MEGGSAGTLFGVNDLGWMDAPNYLSWFTKLFLPAVAYLTKTAPVVLLQDGHHSHISLELIKRARDNNVIILCLPPNTTHLLQPLDIAVFAPLKKAWRLILKEYKLKSRGQVASKEVFPSLICKLWEVSFKQEHIKGGFRGAGLVPYSRAHVLEKLSPANPQSTHKPSQSTHITCSKCGHEMPATPSRVKSHVVKYFSDILEVRASGPQIGERNNLKIRVEGEAITKEEFQTLLEESKKSKTKKKKGKSKEQASEVNGMFTKIIGEGPFYTKSCIPHFLDVDENICQECGANYEEDEHQDAWIGCDNNECGRWFHYYCAGFDKKPSKRKKFICNYC